MKDLPNYIPFVLDASIDAQYFPSDPLYKYYAGFHCMKPPFAFVDKENIKIGKDL